MSTRFLEIIEKSRKGNPNNKGTPPKPSQLNESQKYVRLQTDKGRFYQTPEGTFPSVTTILTATDPKGNGNIERIKRENPALAQDWDRLRYMGTLVHGVVSAYYRHGEHWAEDQDFPHGVLMDGKKLLGIDESKDILDELQSVKPQVAALRDVLYQFRSPLWSEGPIGELANNSALTIGDDQIPRIWHPRLGYAGCPDIALCKYRGETVMVDIKTSNCRYSRSYGKGKFKFDKVKLQLAAYDLAMQHTLDVPPHDKLLAMVVHPLKDSDCMYKAQIIELTEDERLTAEKDWKQRVYQYKAS
jgi:hypothetical protein